MSSPSGSVAVLLFALSAPQEARRKPLTASVVRSERLWQSLENLTLSKIEAAGLPVFVAHRLAAGGLTFGEQLGRAAQVVLDRGYESVICIGNDCPDLRPADLREAARLLQTGLLPVGTDRRGGTYLLGLNRAVLEDHTQLTALPWQTPHLVQAVVKLLHKQGQQPALLTASRADWNTRPDVCLSQVSGAKKWRFLIAEVLYRVRIGYLVRHVPDVLLRRTQPGGLRAPPV